MQLCNCGLATVGKNNSDIQMHRNPFSLPQMANANLTDFFLQQPRIKKNNICNILCKKINRTDKRKDLPVEVFIITRTFWRLFLNKPFKNLVGLKISFILCLLVRIRTRTPYCRPTTTLNERGEAAWTRRTTCTTSPTPWWPP